MDRVERWEVARLGPLCLEAIRALHQPPERYRISLSRYPAGTSFPCVARASRRYVLAGACAFTVGAQTWELRAGDVADIPAGEHQFRVTGSDPVEFVSVWELPPEFRHRRVKSEPAPDPAS